MGAGSFRKLFTHQRGQSPVLGATFSMIKSTNQSHTTEGKSPASNAAASINQSSHQSQISGRVNVQLRRAASTPHCLCLRRSIDMHMCKATRTHLIVFAYDGLLCVSLPLLAIGRFKCRDSARPTAPLRACCPATSRGAGQDRPGHPPLKKVPMAQAFAEDLLKVKS